MLKNTMGQFKKHGRRAFLLAVCVALLTAMCPFVLHASAETLDGWQVVYEDPAKAGFITQVDGSGPLHVTNTAGSKAFICLNGEGSDSELKSLFGKDDMSKYTVEYDITATAITGEFAWTAISYFDTDFKKEAVQMQHNSSYSFIAYEHLASGAEGYSSIPSSPCKKIGVGTPQSIKFVKNGASVSYSSSGENASSGLTTFSATIAANISSMPGFFPDSQNMTASGYVGFYIDRTECVISNVKVTNDTTGRSKTFFSDVRLPTVEGWQISYSNTTKTDFITQTGGTGALNISSPNDNTAQAFMSLNGEQSDAALKTMFPNDGMANYTLEYDVKMKSLTQIGWAVIAYNDINFNYESLQMMSIGQWSYLDMEYPAGNAFGSYDNDLRQALINGRVHHITITKNGADFTWKLDDGADRSAYSCTLPVNISKNATPSHDMTASGYVGFYLNQFEGQIANVKVTNDTTGQSKTFFAGTLAHDPLPTVEGWQASYSNPAAAPAAAIDSTGALNLTKVVGNELSLTLNGDGASAENKALFGKNNMKSYTMEYDIYLDEIDPAGGMGWAIIAYDQYNINIESLQVRHIMPWTYLDKEFPAGEVYGAILEANLWKSAYGDGQLHHITIQKDGANFLWIMDDGQSMKSAAYTLPQFLEGANGKKSNDMTASGFVGFQISGIKGKIANVKVTNAAGDSRTFFEANLSPVNNWSVNGRNPQELTENEDDGISSSNYGSVDDHTSSGLFYGLPIDFTRFNFEMKVDKFPEVSDFWMGFNLLHNGDNFTTEVPDDPDMKELFPQGLVARIFPQADGSAIVKLYRHIADTEGYAFGDPDTLTEVTIPEFIEGGVYNFGCVIDEGVFDLYYNNTKIASIDGFGEIFGGNRGFFTFTSSATPEPGKSSLAKWSINTMNGISANIFDSVLSDDVLQSPLEDWGMFTDEDEEEYDYESDPDTGDKTNVFILSSLLLLSACAAFTCKEKIKTQG